MEISEIYILYHVPNFLYNEQFLWKSMKFYLSFMKSVYFIKLNSLCQFYDKHPIPRSVEIRLLVSEINTQ